MDRGARNAKELLDQRLHEKRMGGLLGLLESLQEVRNIKMTVSFSAENFAAMEEKTQDWESKSLQRDCRWRRPACESVSTNTMTKETERIPKMVQHL